MDDKKIEFYIDTELKKVVEGVLEVAIKENSTAVIQVEHEGKFYWIKRPREVSSNKFQKFAYNLTKIRGLIPVVEKTEKEVLFFEVSKLKQLKEKGINVPTVAGFQENYFVLEDTGKDVRSILRDKNTTLDEVEEILKKCVSLLAHIHKLNLYHAGAQVKNFTYKEGKVSVIDFEDSFDENASLKDIQFRDFFLFLVSLTDTWHEIDYKEIIDIYKNKTGNTTIDKELKKIAKRLNFLVRLVEFKPLYKHFSDDVLSNYKLIKTLQQL